MSSPIIDQTIFDTHREYAPTKTIFLQAFPGLLDSINRPHPRLHDLYKDLKSKDWDENEFNLISCQEEFLTVKPSIVNRMTTTLAWQWEGDSAAAHAIAPVVAPFISCDEAWLCYQRISDNEGLHALAYSEIVKLGLGPDAKINMQQVLANLDSLKRLATVANSLGHVKKVGAKLVLGLISAEDDEAIDAALLFAGTMLCLERIQFMQSFATTFAIGELNMFIPIVSTVGKIATDEYSVHVPVGKYVIQNERQVERSIKSLARIRPVMEKIINETTASEIEWNRLQHQGGEDLPGISEGMFEDFILYGANDVYNTFGWPNPNRVVARNPLPFMDDWLNLNTNQKAPQEEKGSNYLLSAVQDGGGFDLSVEDL